MISVRNGGHETIVVLHSSNFLFREEIPPQGERRFTGFTRGYYLVQRAHRPPLDARFDPRGGDPYNRVGAKAIP